MLRMLTFPGTSADIAGLLSDETGTGAVVLATSPTITTPTVSGASSFNHSAGVVAVTITGPTTGNSGDIVQVIGGYRDGVGTSQDKYRFVLGGQGSPNIFTNTSINILGKNTDANSFTVSAYYPTSMLYISSDVDTAPVVVLERSNGPYLTCFNGGSATPEFQINSDGTLRGTVTVKHNSTLGSGTGQVLNVQDGDGSQIARIGVQSGYTKFDSKGTNGVWFTNGIGLANTLGISNVSAGGGLFFDAGPTYSFTTSSIAVKWFVIDGGNKVFGYSTGSGSTVTQGTSRTTGVTINAATGNITLVSAAGSASWQSFTVTNSTVAANDTIRVVQKSGTDKYQIHVTAVGAGSFEITYATTGGTTTEQPVFNFSVMKGSAN